MKLATQLPTQLLFPTDAPSRDLVGGKAASLAALGDEFPVPAWVALPASAFFDSLSSVQLAQVREQGLLQGELSLPLSLQEELRQALRELTPEGEGKTLFAVRSSATSEDGADASYAGQLESFLQVPAAEVPQQITEVWRSAFSERVRQYRAELDQQAPAAPAVLVQVMVNAQVSGVAFSADPISGNRQLCIINAIEGLGEDLVQGIRQGDHFSTDKSGKLLSQKLAAQTPVLSANQLAQVAQLCSQVETHFNCPQDIEWAFDQSGKLFLLQARPITTLPTAKALQTSQQNSSKAPSSPPTIEAEADPSQTILWDNSNIVESYSGVSSPLTFSFARQIYEHVYLAFCRMLGVPRRRLSRHSHVFANLLGSVNGHIYYNLLNWYRVLALLPGYQMNRAFMEQMMGVKEPLPPELLAQISPHSPSKAEKFRDALALFNGIIQLAGHQLRLTKTKVKFTQRLDTALASTEDLDHLSLPELAQAYRSLQAQLLRRWDAPLINDFLCMMAFGISRKFLGKAAGEPGLALHAQAMIGQGDIISAEPVQRIQQMTKLVLQAPERELLTKSLLAGKADLLPQHPELQKLYHAYLAKFGQRCLQELKLESPTLHDDPSVLLSTIGLMAKAQSPKQSTQPQTESKPTKPEQSKAEQTNPDQAKTPPASKQQNWEEQLQTLLPKHPLRRLIAKHATRWARARVRDRENLRFERTRVFGRVRQLFVEIGKRLHAQGELPKARDIFLLELEEILALIEGTSTLSQATTLKALLEARRLQQTEFAQLPTPPNRFSTQGASFEQFRQLAQRFPGQNPPAKQALAASQTSTFHPTSTQVLEGIACSAGLIRARARVIRNPREAKLEAGEILVAQFTDPGWITLFANASGVLVERGSLLSHSAIVARELGIPAIVAIEQLLQQVQTGDLLEMDGKSGQVRILESASTAEPLDPLTPAAR